MSIVECSMHLRANYGKPLVIFLWVGWLAFAGGTFAGAAEEPPSFFRGLNLNGPPVTIDENTWEGKDSPNYASDDRAFENQSVPLVPTTDPERAKMIRSSRWGGNRIELKNVPAGTYTLFVYVWEDNNPE